MSGRRIYVNPDADDGEGAVLLDGVKVGWHEWKQPVWGVFYDIDDEVSLDLFFTGKRDRLYVWTEDGGTVHHFEAVYGEAGWGDGGRSRQFTVAGEVHRVGREQA